MGLNYNKPTWTNDHGAAINAERLQAISDVIDGLINQDKTKAVVDIQFSGQTMYETFADGTIKETDNPLAGPQGPQGPQGPPGRDGSGAVQTVDPTQFNLSEEGNLELSSGVTEKLAQIDDNAEAIEAVNVGIKNQYEKGFLEKNIVNVIAKTTIINGITFTPFYDSDGRLQCIDADGTSTGTAYFVLNSVSNDLNGDFTIKIKDKVYGTLGNEASQFTFNYYTADNKYGAFDGNGLENIELKSVYIQLLRDRTVNHVKLYPMIRPAGTDDTYVPYSGKSNRELTKELADVKKVVTKTYYGQQTSSVGTIVIPDAEMMALGAIPVSFTTNNSGYYWCRYYGIVNGGYYQFGVANYNFVNANAETFDITVTYLV